MKKSSAKISTLVAVSGGLAALPAAAIELGDAQVNSSLGQPLRASIAYALAPNESLLSSCVSLQGGAPQDGMPAVGPATITVANGVISIAGKTAVRDPLVTMRVNVRCAYTANLSRDYMLFIDPPGAPTQVTTTQIVAAPAVARPVVATPATATSRRRAAVIEPVVVGERHRVQPGESLSEIAQGIVDRPVGLWTAVGAIFDANPGAFIDNDPNKLKAGSWLTIPDFEAEATTTLADNNVFATESTTSAEPVTNIEPATSVETALAAEPATTVLEPTAVEPVQDVEEFVDDNPYVTPGAAIGETVVSIPDTTLAGPAVTSSSPNVPTASIQPTVVEESSTNWLLWLVGGGIALIGTLLLFGRVLRDRFGSAPVGVIAGPQRRRSDLASDGNTHQIEAVSEIEVEFEELSATQENLALDADLIVGTGLQEGSEMDVAQDFGFAATTELDLELPEEMSSGAADQSSHTDIIPPLNIEVESILDSEELDQDAAAESGGDEDDYDMSVIVDATKVPLPDDTTQMDLEAIPVETSDETLITGDYTVSHEVDYKVLEQDYEDEFSATQALNNEISRAAAELAARMDEEFSEEDTKEMSLASVTALDITAQLPANNDELSDLDDTGINEVTVNMQDTDNTVEMPADDSTVEMPAKKGKSA